MKKWSILAVVACAFALCLALAGCGSSGSDSSGAPEAPAPEAAAPEAAAPEAAAPEAPAAASGLSAADLATADVVVALDDYDAMKALSSDIQNGNMTDKVVQIDGYVSNFAKGMSYNIVENNADGSGNVGTTFVIEGADESAYPSDGTHIKITGKVALDENGVSFVIHTVPECIEVL